MRLPFLWISAAFSSGIIAGRFLEFECPWKWLGMIVFLLLFLAGRKSFLPVLMAVFFCLGAVHAGLYNRISPDDPGCWLKGLLSEKSPFCTFYGKVQSPPEKKMKGRRVLVSFVLHAEAVTYRDENHRWKKVHLDGRVQVFCFQPQEVPEYGDRVRIYGTLERPKSARNSGEMDYRNYLKEKKIFSVLSAYGRSLHVLEKSKGGIMPWLMRLRSTLVIRIENRFEGESAKVLKALITGIQKDIASELRDEFVKTGTSHLLAVSGLNITLVAGSFYLILIGLGVPQKVSACVGLVLVGLYAAMAGFGFPVQRSAWMAASVFFALILERSRNTLNGLFLALFLLVWIDPNSLSQIGFQLSFVSVLSLILFMHGFRNQWGYGEIFYSTGAAVAGTFPLVIYYFNVISLSGFLANLWAIPLFHLGLMSGFLSLIPWLGVLIKPLADGLIQAALSWIRFCSSFPHGYFYLPTPSAWQMAGYYACLAGIIYLKEAGPRPVAGLFRFKPPWRIVHWSTKILFLCILSTFFMSFREPSDIEITFFSLGKNDAVYFRTKEGKHWLVNTGRGGTSDQAHWVIEPFLKKQGAKSLEGILLTDFYKKHTGGLETILRNHAVKKIYGPPFFLDKRFRDLKVPKDRYQALENGQSLDLGNGIFLTILSIKKGRVFFEIRQGVFRWIFSPFPDAALFSRLPHDQKKYTVIMPCAVSPEMSPGWIRICPGGGEVGRKFILYDPVREGAIHFKMTAGRLWIRKGI